MLTRRSLLGSSAVLAAGCSTVGSPLSPPSAPQVAEINVAAYTRYGYLSMPFGEDAFRLDPEEKYQRAVTALEEDRENHYGPAHGGYRLALRFFEDDYGTMEESPKSQEEMEAAQAAAIEAAAGILEILEADLVTVWPEEARWWGRNGLLLPLDRFSGAEEADLTQEFYPSVLNQYRIDGVQYALPVGAKPLMLYYDAEHFAELGVSPPDASWDWNNLAENAVKLTTKKADGTVARWGLVARGERIFWALWQNEATLVDMDTLQCGLQAPAAVEALQFVHDLMHKHRVSPTATLRDLWDYLMRTPPAMLYRYPPLYLNQSNRFRMAALPRGKVPAVPVRTAFGIGIAARTQNTEAAYTALRGFTRAMQAQVAVPSSRAAVAQLSETRKDLRPEEVAAVQHAMEHGREWPQQGLPLQLMYELTENLGRGEDVATVVNKACTTVNDFRQTGKLPTPWD